MDFGPVTDTRTIEGAVVRALAKLRGAPDTETARDLTKRALRYRDILASWEMIPPSPGEQTETIAGALNVIGAIMKHLSPDDWEGEDDATFDSVPPPPPEEAEEADASPRHQQISVGRIELTQPATAGASGKIDLLFPFRRRWIPVPGVRGVLSQSLYGSDKSGTHHVMVRLEADAILDEHRQEAVELIYVVRGGISLGDDKLFAGSVVRIRDGARCPAIRGLGDSELLFVGTCRANLCG